MGPTDGLTAAVDRLLDLALAEDVGTGDLTTEALVDPGRSGRGIIRAKEPLVVAGLQAAERVFHRFDPEARFDSDLSDGTQVESGREVASVDGNLRALLAGERTALNFLQRLSGIATHVRSHVAALEGRTVRLVDTRKTIPGWRVLEKYAVRVGGAANHRFGLFDGVLIKDNHIAVSGGISAAVALARRRVHHLVRIEVEVADMAGVEEALAAGADVIMLDNMDLAEIREATVRIGGRALVEVSGGVTRDALSALADAGVDIISAGGLTHAARSVDLSMGIRT